MRGSQARQAQISLAVAALCRKSNLESQVSNKVKCRIIITKVKSEMLVGRDDTEHGFGSYFI